MAGHPSSRAEVNRHRAEEARTKGKQASAPIVRETLLQIAATWERMAEWEERKHRDE